MAGCLPADDGRTFRAVGEVETYGPTSFPSPRGDGATAVLPYVVFADRTRKAVLSNATAYALDPASGVLRNYSFGVRLTFPKRIKTNPACNGGTCVNWWARRAIPLKDGSLLTMLGNLQYENDTHYSVASVVSSDGGYNWRLQTEISTGACVGTAPCGQDVIANSGTLEGPNEVDVVRLEDGSLLTVYRVSSPGPYFHSRSTTEGRVWSSPRELPGCHSVDPALELLRVGGREVLLLSGGRPGLFLHASVTGGETWTSYNILANHNALLPAGSASAGRRYPPWAVDVTLPQSGETVDGTSGYTALVAVDGGRGAIVCYDKMDSKTQDRLFCMRVAVALEDASESFHHRLKTDDQAVDLAAAEALQLLSAISAAAAAGGANPLYDLWLSYRPLPAAAAAAVPWRAVHCNASLAASPLRTACRELSTGLSAMLGRTISTVGGSPAAGSQVLSHGR
jgi:hypothetical protein